MLIDHSQRALLTGAAIRHLARQLRPVSIEIHVKIGKKAHMLQYIICEEG